MKTDCRNLPIDADGLPPHCLTWAMVALACAISMAILDSYIMNIVLPTLAHDFRVNPSTATWIVNGYQLAIVSSILPFSSLSEIVGCRRIFLIGAIMFCITSVLCALSDSFITLLIARIFQGFSASAIMSVSTALIKRVFPRAHIGRGMGINAMVVSISAATVPSIAGGILALSSWHWLFAINFPLRLPAFIFGYRFLPKTIHDNQQKYDYISAIANAITFGLLFYTIDGFAHHNSLIRLFVQLGIVFAVGYFFIHRQLHQTKPLLPIDLLRIPFFRLSITASVCSFIAQMLAMISLPFYFQNSMGMNEVMTGLMITPWPVAALIMGPTAGYLIEKVKPALIGSIGMIIFCGGLFSLSYLDPHSTHFDVMWRVAITGMGFALFQTPNNSAIMSSAPSERSGSASGMLSMGRLIGQTFGTTLVAILFSYIVKDESTAVSLQIASGLAMLAAIFSASRLRKQKKAPTA